MMSIFYQQNTFLLFLDEQSNGVFLLPWCKLMFIFFSHEKTNAKKWPAENSERGIARSAWAFQWSLSCIKWDYIGYRYEMLLFACRAMLRIR